ncbi:hypothetical protein B0A55_07981 [Friedmanniomyces simplex]|uniref:Uncharacterized protein n=1 Tax=Friedmanniomyces simplex TaxID=329884 RepID=A0A4U0X468_9PEZI|nr:hypothetical protein B0A55_09444 [Friedmanniomyces simplex]TKA69928.1 hypothetical protein B0A55_07981 [Friedmanniomyces simplex]
MARSVPHVTRGTLLQSPRQSLIAQRRTVRRAELDVAVAHAEHARQWRRFVFEREARFEEQADELRLRIRSYLCRRHREDVHFSEVDYTSGKQPRTQLARAEDGEPVSPRTKPMGEEAMAIQESKSAGDEETWEEDYASSRSSSSSLDSMEGLLEGVEPFDFIG